MPAKEQKNAAVLERFVQGAETHLHDFLGDRKSVV